MKYMSQLEVEPERSSQENLLGSRGIGGAVPWQHEWAVRGGRLPSEEDTFTFLKVIIIFLWFAHEKQMRSVFICMWPMGA